MSAKETIEHLDWFIDYVTNKLRLVEKETGKSCGYHSALLGRLRRARKSLDTTSDTDGVVNATLARILSEVEEINKDLMSMVRQHYINGCCSCTMVQD